MSRAIVKHSTSIVLHGTSSPWFFAPPSQYFCSEELTAISLDALATSSPAHRAGRHTRPLWQGSVLIWTSLLGWEYQHLLNILSLQPQHFRLLPLLTSCLPLATSPYVQLLRLLVLYLLGPWRALVCPSVPFGPWILSAKWEQKIEWVPTGLLYHL